MVDWTDRDAAWSRTKQPFADCPAIPEAVQLPRYVTAVGPDGAACRDIGALEAIGRLVLWHRSGAPYSRIERRRYVPAAVRRMVSQRPCVVCHSWDDVQADHIIPFSRGGTNEVHNFQPLCRSCNMDKGAQTMDEWIEQMKNALRS